MGDDEVRTALREFAEPVMMPLLTGADRAMVEQLYCFAAAVWNAVVLLDVLGNFVFGPRPRVFGTPAESQR